jgi:hypothetical protein
MSQRHRGGHLAKAPFAIRLSAVGSEHRPIGGWDGMIADHGRAVPLLETTRSRPVIDDWKISLHVAAKGCVCTQMKSQSLNLKRPLQL